MSKTKVVENSNMGRYVGAVDGEVIPALITGDTGQTYHGRTVVMFKHALGMFGTRIEGKERMRKLTINNGILNQCSLSEPPTPYWAILDAASELKKNFTRAQVIELALKVFGEKKAVANSEGVVNKSAKEISCDMAWDVLRNHHRHARKCNAGMAYMIDSEGGGKLSIRARCPDETLQYFERASARKKMLVVSLKNGEKQNDPITPVAPVASEQKEQLTSSAGDDIVTSPEA